VQRADGAARRAKYLADAENVAVNYFGRLQEPDGSWRWRAWNPEPALLKKIEERRAAGRGDKFEQPFMAGIYMEAAVALHRLTRSAEVKAALQGQMARHAEHLMRDCYVASQTPGLTSIPRVLLYFYPREFVFDPTASDRHLTTSVIHTFGYLYAVTGDQRYKTWGDELWDSCFAVNPKDGLRSGLDEGYHLKLFTGEFRSSGRYLAWRQDSPTNPTPKVSMKTDGPASTGLVAGALAKALAFSTDGAGKEQIELLVDEIKEAQRAFAAEIKYFLSAESVREELEEALSNATKALAMTAKPDSDATIKSRMEWTATRLKRAQDKMKQ
jgi:hypothetical protein